MAGVGPVIFLTIGTHEPFDRLVRAFDEWCATTGADLRPFGQITEPRPAGYRPQHFQWVARLSPRDYAATIARADIIVSHAGMGSILTSLHVGKPIVVMPRRGHLRETRNDHQYATVRMLGDRPGIHVAEDESQLAGAIDAALEALAAPSGAHIPALADPGFTDALRAFLTGADPTSGRLPRRR